MIDNLTVRCEADSHKRGKVAKVAIFTRSKDPTVGVMRALAAARGEADMPVDEEQGPVWRQVLPPGKRGSGIHGNLDKLAGTTAQLVGDAVIQSHWTEPQPDPATMRTRYRLHCPLCGLVVSARTEQLDPVLSTIADAGLDTVDLAPLGRVLSWRRT